MCKSWLQNYVFSLFMLSFPFFMFFNFCSFLCFLLFWVDKGVSLTPTYSSIVMRKSNLRSSLRTERCLSYFYLFWKIGFNRTKVILRRWTLNDLLNFDRRESLRRWTLKRPLDFWKERIVKVLDLETISLFFYEMKKFMSWFYLVLAH